MNMKLSAKPLGLSGNFPALPALTTDYKAVRRVSSLIFLHWFRRFPANVEPAVRVSAGSVQVSVQDLEVLEVRKRLKVSGQCRKCSFGKLYYYIFSSNSATASISNGKSSTLCNLPSRPKTMLVGKP